MRRSLRALALASAVGATVAVVGPMTASAGPNTGIGREMDNFTDMTTAQAELQARSAAPFGSVAPGAYNAGLAQAESLASAGGSWHPYGSAPECGAQTTTSSVCPAPGADNGQYSGVGALGFRTLSGRVTSLAVDPYHPYRIWASAAGGGVWQSDNAGNTWRSVGDGLPTQVVGAIAYDAPAHRLLVGTGDNSFGGSGISGDGFYWSSTDGRSWHLAGGVPLQSLSFRIVVSPADRTGNTVYLASSRGLFRSTNAGLSFVNEDLPTTPPGYRPNCAGNTTTPVCFFASVVTDVVVKGTSSANAPAGAVMAVVGWRAGQKQDTNADGTTNTSCTQNGTPTACLQAPRNGVYISRTGAPGSFGYQDQSVSSQGFAPDSIVGRTALGIANGRGQNQDAVYALVQDAQKLNHCQDVLDTVLPTCNADVQGYAVATVLDGLYASYDFGHSWTKIMDWTQLKYTGTNSALYNEAGYSPGIQGWYNLWVQPDPTATDASGNPTRVLFGLEEVWENNLTVPGVLTDPWEAHQTPVPGLAPWHVIGRYWNACGGVNTQVPCNPDLSSSPIPGSTTHPDQHAVLMVPGSHGAVTLYVGSDGGVFRQTVGAGADFTNDSWGDGQNLGLSTLQPYDAEMAKDGTVVSGLQDNGELKITPSGKEYEIYGGDGFYTTIDPNNSQNIIEEYTYGVSSLTNDGGATWFPIQPGGCSGGPSDSLFATPLEQDPTMAGHVVEGCTAIQEATNAYANPCTVPPGAPSAECVTNGSPFTTVYTLPTAPSGTNYIPSALGVRGPNIYVGFCGYCDVVTGGLPFRSGIATNVGGAQAPQIGSGNGWHIVDPTCSGCGTPDGKLPQRYITSIQMDPANPDTVYVTMGGYGRRWIPPGALGDSTREVGVGHLFVSHDAGRSFTNISGNLPDVPADWTVVHDGRLVVSTDIGVFIGSTTGGTFETLGYGLPHVPVFTLRLSPADPNLLLASTYGRGDWTYRFAPTAHTGSAGPAARGGAGATAGSTARTRSTAVGLRTAAARPAAAPRTAPVAASGSAPARLGLAGVALALVTALGILVGLHRRRRVGTLPT